MHDFSLRVGPVTDKGTRTLHIICKMASSYYRFARRSLPPTATAAAATAALIVSLSNNNDKIDDRGHKDSLLTSQQDLKSSGKLPFNYNPLYNSLLSPTFAYSLIQKKNVALCETPSVLSKQAYKPLDPTDPDDEQVETKSSNEKKVTKSGMWGAEEGDGLYHGLFPRRQLWRPTLEYPLWDYNWDGRKPPPIIKKESIENENGGEKQMTEGQRDRYIRKNGVTRHIIMIRHGQYDETHKEDEKRILTPLGRKQAELTGQRLGKLIRGVNEDFGPCKVKVVHVSDLARAKESADIIYDNMNLDNFDGDFTVSKSDPDPLLNEGRPCHHIPGGKARDSVVERTDEQHPRIEQAFKKYFYRAEMPALPSGPEEEGSEKSKIIATSDESDNADGGTEQSEQKLNSHPQHEFEIIVCHGNVIRYMFCRALQLPPEAWLRLCTFNCSLTYFTIRPTGTVSCRMMGDIGHLPHDMCTFSMHPGFNW